MSISRSDISYWTFKKGMKSMFCDSHLRLVLCLLELALNAVLAVSSPAFECFRVRHVL